MSQEYVCFWDKGQEGNEEFDLKRHGKPAMLAIINKAKKELGENIETISIDTNKLNPNYKFEVITENGFEFLYVEAYNWESKNIVCQVRGTFKEANND